MVYAVCVEHATITGVTNGATVDADTTVSCDDDNARPFASYRWTNHVDGSHSTGVWFKLTAHAQYKLTCNASNNFDRSGCYATDYVEFNSKLQMH